MNNDIARSARVVRWSAAYDLVVAAPFATPWTAQLVGQLLGHVHMTLGLPGTPPVLDGLAMLFANLMGSVVLVWSIVRLRTPTRALGAADTAARVLFSTWQARAIVAGASWTLIPFLVLEVAWGLVQGIAVVRWRDDDR